MALNKNDICEITIEDLGVGGEGIGKADGYTVFVKDTVIGDVARVKIIKARKNYGYGRLISLIRPSDIRQEPRCASARACGGCQIQHIRYEEQLRFKQEKVKGLLRHIGGVKDPVMLPIIGMDDPWFYRNKVQYPVGLDKEGRAVTGFYAGRTHAIIPVETCCIQDRRNEKIMAAIRRWIDAYHISVYDETAHRGLIRHILTRIGRHTDEIMVCLVANGDSLPHVEPLIEELKTFPGMTSICLNINREKTNVILGDQVRCLWGQRYITDRIGDVSYRISPLSFFQVNPVQTEVLYRTALEFAALKETDRVWDLYCGIGTISLFLARHAKQVRGVEIIPQAIDDARENARINGIKNASFFVGKAEEVLPAEYARTGEGADVIVVDPPRKGCDEKLLDCMVKMAPDRIVYVSCDPATLARDVKILEARGYKLEKARCVDMFPHSVHVECVCAFVPQIPR